MTLNYDAMNNHLILWIATIFVSVVFTLTAFDSARAQADNFSAGQEIITSNETFAPTLDLFAVPESIGGYGVYEDRSSNTFAPGEDIVLYVEPVGFSYQPLAFNNDTLYLMNFTADVVIADSEGSIVGGFQNLPISEIVSHHQNKEINLVITLSQSEPFPEGNYHLLYSVHDGPSGNIFDIAKDITISSTEGT